MQSKALQTASTVPHGLSRFSGSKVCFAYFTGTHLYSSPNISLNGHSVIFQTMKTIWSNHAGKAWLREYSIKVESFGQTFANCLILHPKREDIPATI